MADRGKPLEEADGRFELGDGAAEVATSQVIQPDAHEQDSLIEIADLVFLGPPENFQGFVLLEILATVELLDPGEQRHRRRLTTAIGVERSVAGHHWNPES